MHRILPLLFGTALIVSCQRPRNEPEIVDTALVYVQAPAPPRGPLRVRLRMRSGVSVLVNGHAATDAGLDSARADAQAAHGGAWVHRAPGASRPRADSVRKALTTSILSHHLAIWIAYRPDFSDLPEKIHSR